MRTPQTPQPPAALYLLDTNILLRLTEVASPMHAATKQSLAALIQSGAILFITAQNIVEFWSVATRPITNNGLGLTAAEAAAELGRHKTAFTLLPDESAILTRWESLVVLYNVQGKQTHDARLAAVALSYKVPNLLTFNDRHLRRFVPEGLTVIDPTDVPTAKSAVTKNKPKQPKKQKTLARYKAVYGEVRLRSMPDPNAPISGAIPADAIVEIVEKEKHWVKTKGFDGWAASTMMERVMDQPAADIRCHSHGYKIVDGVYRNFFGFQNIGTAEYSDTLTLRLYHGDTLVKEHIFDCAIQPQGGGAPYFDTAKEITRFEAEGRGVFCAEPNKGLIEN